jgi:hypothetical protein
MPRIHSAPLGRAKAHRYAPLVGECATSSVGQRRLVCQLSWPSLFRPESGGFWYAALRSAFYEFGIEALFERSSYQDLIITPVAGTLLGALLFEPIRELILGKPELRWCDHLTLTVTDPLGAANSVLERSVGVQTDIRVQFFLPGLAPHAQFADHTTRPRNRRQEHHYRSPGVGIEFVFAGRRRSTRRAQYERPRGKRRGH